MLNKLFFIGILATCLIMGRSAFSDDLDQAPPNFNYNGGKAVFIDIKDIDLELSFDYAKKKAIGHAKVEFYTRDSGFPIIDLEQTPTLVSLNNQTVQISDFPTITAPDKETTFRVLKKKVMSNSTNTLVIDYNLSHSNITYDSGAVRAGFFMWDIDDGGFWERYGPSSFEYDQLNQTVRVKVMGNTVEQSIFANGKVEKLSDSEWMVTYPSYFTTSSFYFHLVPKGRFIVKQENFTGIAASFALTVYAEEDYLATSGLSTAKSVLKELEQIYGPFPHQKLLIYVTPDGGGMEYCGAAMTSLSTLEHEINHSWFARGVMPINGNAGWMDEAIVTWRDDGFDQAGGPPNRDPANLSGYSPYKKFTTYLAYSDGAELISEFDFMFKDKGGMKKILRKLFQEKKHQVISTEFFRTFLEDLTGHDLKLIFERYVYGKDVVTEENENTTDHANSKNSGHRKSKHPRPYTAQELARFH